MRLPYLKMPPTVVIIPSAAEGWKYGGRNSDRKERPLFGPVLDCLKGIEAIGLDIGHHTGLIFQSSGFLRLLRYVVPVLSPGRLSWEAEVNMSYWFFLSYARYDLNPTLTQFYDDLADAVRLRAGGEKKDVGFFDGTLGPGESWDRGVRKGTSNLPSFCRSVFCHLFRSRVLRQGVARVSLPA
jgi:hypothetical protein